MYALLLTMRLLHVLLGVFWAGALVFNALFLVPAMRDAGPEGAKVGAALMRRRFLDIMPIVALLTLISGFWLYWRASSGFRPAFMRSGPGVMWGIGAVAAVIAFGIGVGIMRPAMLRAAALAGTAAQLPPEGQEARMTEVLTLRLRAGKAGQIVALLLVIATAAMAVGRYA